MMILVKLGLLTYDFCETRSSFSFPFEPNILDSILLNLSKVVEIPHPLVIHFSRIAFFDRLNKLDSCTCSRKIGKRKVTSIHTKKVAEGANLFLEQEDGEELHCTDEPTSPNCDR